MLASEKIGLYFVVLYIASLVLFLWWFVVKLYRRSLRDSEELQQQQQQQQQPVGTGSRPEPIPKDQLEKIPTFQYDEGGPSTSECCVCMEGLEQGDRYRILPPCGHRFHVVCIDQWLLRTRTCPTCRAVVSLESDASEMV